MPPGAFLIGTDPHVELHLQPLRDRIERSLQGDGRIGIMLKAEQDGQDEPPADHELLDVVNAHVERTELGEERTGDTGAIGARQRDEEGLVGHRRTR